MRALGRGPSPILYSIGTCGGSSGFGSSSGGLLLLMEDLILPVECRFAFFCVGEVLRQSF